MKLGTGKTRGKRGNGTGWAVALAVAGLLFVHGPGYAQDGSGEESAANLTVVVDGIRDGRGGVRVAVHTDAATWPSGERPHAAVALRSRPGALTFTLNNLPPGQYAISAFHDENDDGALNTNFFGVPREGYGFSNGASNFERALLDVKGGDNTVTVTLGY